MMDGSERTLYESCCNQEWSEARDYLLSPSNTTSAAVAVANNDEKKKLNVMYRSGSGSGNGSGGKTCLHRACSYRAGANIVQVLLDIGGKALVMIKNDHGDTALHSACLYGASYEVIKMLVNVGGKDLVMTKNNCDNTALHWLCHYIKIQTEVAEKIILLLDAGDANLILSTENNDGKTPLQIATELKGAFVERKEEEVQQRKYSTSKVVSGGTKRKRNDEEHEEEDSSVAVSQSTSSKRIKVGNVPITTASVASESTNQAGDEDDAVMIAEKFLFKEREQHSKLMKRFLDTQRELRSAKARILQLEQKNKDTVG